MTDVPDLCARLRASNIERAAVFKIMNEAADALEREVEIWKARNRDALDAEDEIARLQEAKRRALAVADERAKEANELRQRIEVLETRETNELHRFRALVKRGLDAINAAICQTQAEQAGHDRTADKYCRTVEQWRKDARAALEADNSRMAP